LIDAVVVSVPQVQPTPKDFVICSNGSDFAGQSAASDYVTLMDVYAPCAALAIDGSDPGSADQQRRARRGAELAARGLLKETTTSARPARRWRHSRERDLARRRISSCHP
jgi:hypothetical protein